MTIKFLFLFFVFFSTFYFFCLFLQFFTSGNDTCHKWPSKLKATVLAQELFWKGLSFGPGLFMSFLSKEKIMAQKYSRKIDNFLFGQRAPRHQSRMILKYYGLVICVFGYWKGVGRLEAVASLDAYQISSPTKTHHFLLPDFEEFAKEILKSEIFLPVV